MSTAHAGFAQTVFFVRWNRTFRPPVVTIERAPGEVSSISASLNPTLCLPRPGGVFALSRPATKEERPDGEVEPLNIQSHAKPIN